MKENLLLVGLRFVVFGGAFLVFAAPEELRVGLSPAHAFGIALLLVMVTIISIQLSELVAAARDALGQGPGGTQLEAMARDVAAIRYQMKNLRRDVKRTAGDGKAEPAGEAEGEGGAS